MIGSPHSVYNTTVLLPPKTASSTATPTQIDTSIAPGAGPSIAALEAKLNCVSVATGENDSIARQDYCNRANADVIVIETFPNNGVRDKVATNNASLWRSVVIGDRWDALCACPPSDLVPLGGTVVAKLH